MKIFRLLLAFGLTFFGATLAQANTPESAPAVIEGKIVKVVPSELEIYVQNSAGKHEFYFSKETTVSAQGQPKEYADLKTGQEVRVTAKKIGKRLDPIAVEILQ